MTGNHPLIPPKNQNYSAQPQEVPVPGTWKDAIGGAQVPASVTLPIYGTMVLRSA